MENMISGILGIFLAYGLLLCFFGFKIFRIQVALSGALLAFIAAGGILTASTSLEQNIILIISAVCAVLGAIIAYQLYLVGVFLTTFIFSGGLLFLLILLASEEPSTSAIAALVSGIILAILAVILNRPAIILLTAFNGATIVGFAATAYVVGADINAIYRSPTILVITTLVLTVLGAIVQFNQKPRASASKTKTAATAEAPSAAPASALAFATPPAPVSAPVFAAEPAPAPVAAPISISEPVPAPVDASMFGEETVAITPPFAPTPVFETEPAPAPVAVPVFEEAPAPVPAPVFEAVPAPAPVFAPEPAPTSAPKFCTNCGAERANDAVFCRKCGAKF